MILNPTKNARMLGRIGLTVTAGVAWPYSFSLVMLAIGYDVLLLQIHLFQNLGVHSADSLKTLIHISDPIIWAVVFGLLFGLPLAVFIRQNVMRYWVLFLMTVLLMVAIGGVQGGSQASEFVTEIVLSPFLVYQSGVLVVWFLAARIISNRASEATATS